MADFDIENSQAFQREIVERVREIQRMLDREVIAYYQADRVDDGADARENLRGLHRYLKKAYQDLDRILDEIERRPEFNLKARKGSNRVIGELEGANEKWKGE